ncbi:hypothetical protein JW899_05130 [Candidatus Uhrbacteria bacterium]|nr:hypothetical protein [Candidatus Uhrbacteria bacterium]
MNCKRWSKRLSLISHSSLAAIGVIWLIINVGNYLSHDWIDKNINTNLTVIILVFVFIVVLIVRRPPSTFRSKIDGKDVWIEIKVGNAHKNKGALVVPINNEFDPSQGGNIIKAKNPSILNELICRYYSSQVEHLITDINQKKDLLRGDDGKYPIGSMVEIEQKNKKFYLLANSYKNLQNRSTSDNNDFLSSLGGLWESLSNDAEKDDVITIPLINTGHGRATNLTRKTSVHYIIRTFIFAVQQKTVCDKLIISIYPDDVTKGNIDLDELGEYLKYACKYYIFNPKPIGTEIV